MFHLNKIKLVQNGTQLKYNYYITILLDIATRSFGVTTLPLQNNIYVRL